MVPQPPAATRARSTVTYMSLNGRPNRRGKRRPTQQRVPEIGAAPKLPSFLVGASLRFEAGMIGTPETGPEAALFVHIGGPKGATVPPVVFVASDAELEGLVEHLQDAVARVAVARADIAEAASAGAVVPEGVASESPGRGECEVCGVRIFGDLVAGGRCLDHVPTGP